jgi:hypothetical protein
MSALLASIASISLVVGGIDIVLGRVGLPHVPGSDPVLRTPWTRAQERLVDPAAAMKIVRACTAFLSHRRKPGRCRARSSMIGNRPSGDRKVTFRRHGRRATSKI